MNTTVRIASIVGSERKATNRRGSVIQAVAVNLDGTIAPGDDVNPAAFRPYRLRTAPPC